MADDSQGRPVQLGDQYALVGKVRKIDSPSAGRVLLVAGTHGLQATAADLIALEALRGIGPLTLYGEDTGTGVTSVNVMSANDDGVGFVAPKKITARQVAVAFRRTHASPGPGAWTLRLKKYNTGAGSFDEVATFSVATI